MDVRLDEIGSVLTFDDGRPGDLEGIFTDIEVIEGSNFNDTLLGSGRNETSRGRDDNDAIGIGSGSDLIDEGSAPMAPTRNGGKGAGDRINYGTRGRGSACRSTVSSTTAPRASRTTCPERRAHDLHRTSPAR